MMGLYLAPQLQQDTEVADFLFQQDMMGLYLAPQLQQDTEVADLLF
jgi:hypothetical protein